MRERKADYGSLVSQGAIWEQMGRDYCGQAAESYEKFLQVDRKEKDPRYRELAKWVSHRSRCRATRMDESLDAQTLALKADRIINEEFGKEKEKYDDKNLDEADRCLTKAIQLDSNNVYLRLRRAELLNWREKFPEWRDEATEVLKLARGKPVPKASLLIALARDGDDRERELRKIVEANPNYTDGLFWLGNTVEKKNPFEAISLLDRQIKLRPFDASLFAQKAALERTNNRYPAALESIKAAIALESNQLDYYRLRMEIEANLAKDPAESAHVRAVGFGELAEMMLKRGDVDSALKNYRDNLNFLAVAAKTETNASLTCEMSLAMRKMARIIERQSSRAKAIEELKSMFGNVKELEVVLSDEIKHLSNSPGM